MHKYSHDKCAVDSQNLILFERQENCNKRDIINEKRKKRETVPIKLMLDIGDVQTDVDDMVSRGH